MLLVPLMFSGAVFAGPERDWLERSVALYREGSYAGAVTVLEGAIAAGHETPEVVYNLACAKAALGEEAVAERLLRRVDAMPGSGGKKGLSAHARFNLGTLAYRRAKSAAENDPASALDVAKLSERFYRGALEVDPRDADAARSVEVVQRLIKELQDKLRQQQEQQSQQQQPQDQQPENGQQGEQSNQGSQQDQQEQNTAQQQNQQGDQQESDAEKQEQPKSDDELAKELGQLAEQQEKLADENKEGMKSGEQQRESQRKQEDLSEKTGRTSQELSKRSEGERDGEQKQRAEQASRQLEEARKLQEQAEQQMDRGEHQDAAESQRQAAEALKRAAEQMGKSGEGQAGEPTQAGAAQPSAEPPEPVERKKQDMTVAEILEKERREAAQRTLKAIRQRMGRARPADKDW
jgi:hypothetical protein